MPEFLHPDKQMEAKEKWLLENHLTQEDIEFDGAEDDNKDFRFAKHTGRIPK